MTGSGFSSPPEYTIHLASKMLKHTDEYLQKQLQEFHEHFQPEGTA